MQQVARLAPNLLRDSTDLVVEFVRDQMHPQGGFRNRAGENDLYYTVFGLESLLALRDPPPLVSLTRYLDKFGGGEGLDLVHLAALARCRVAARQLLPRTKRDILARRLEYFRSSDGGYHQQSNATKGNVYACFLALGAYQDLELKLPDWFAFRECIRSLGTAGANISTPSLAAAATLVRYLDLPVPADLRSRLLSRLHPHGGFSAAAGTPMPDLLTTAVTLHALSGLQAPFEGFREPCLDFVDSLWTNRGSFYGHWKDDVLDCEYTYYGLLALGHLSV